MEETTEGLGFRLSAGEPNVGGPNVLMKHEPSFPTKARILACLHQDLPEDYGPLTSLIVFEFEHNRNREAFYVSGTTIAIQFTSIDNVDPNPEIHAIAPGKILSLTPSATQSWTWAEGNDSDKARVQGFTSRDHGLSDVRNVANWVLRESAGAGGIPNLIRLPVVLKRKSDKRFQAQLELTSRAKKESPPMVRIMKGMASANDSILIDPSFSFGPQSVREIIRHKNLYDDELLRFTSMGKDRATVQDVFYVELWNLQTRGSVAMPNPPRPLEPTLPIPRTDVSGFEGLPCLKWSPSPAPVEGILRTSFPMVINERSQDRSQANTFFSVIVRKSEPPREGSNPPPGLFDPDALKVVGELFHLPPAYQTSLQDEGGCCLRIDNTCVLQTPFDTEGSWSLILRWDKGENNGAAIIQTAQDTEIIDALMKVHRETTQYLLPHPILLLELFVSYERITSKRYKMILEHLRSVDEVIKKQLGDDGTDYNFAKLSQTLHDARMASITLNRRSNFESNVRKELQGKLPNDVRLTWSIEGSKSDGYRQGIQNLTERINSQATVVYGLIAQRDARLQYRLAKRTSMDSKAMKTLAIITIIFLPGTFVATLFATNMVEFQPGQQGWIYAAVVIPFTVILVIAWALWLNKKAREPDEEDRLESKGDQGPNTKTIKQH